MMGLAADADLPLAFILAGILLLAAPIIFRLRRSIIAPTEGTRT